MLGNGLPARPDKRGNDDTAPTARAVASEALAKYGNDDDRDLALAELLELANPQGETTNTFTAIAALNAIDELGLIAMPLHEKLKQLPKQPKGGHARTRGYTGRLLQKILGGAGCGGGSDC